MGSSRYRSMWLGTIGAVVIAIVAGVVLNAVPNSSQDVFSTPNVRVAY